MDRAAKVLVQAWMLNGVIATYLHEPSHIEIQQSETGRNTDFGFSMGYWSNRHSLVIGAPHHDHSGKVFIVPMNDIFARKITNSTEIVIDMEKYAGDYDRTLAPDQNFCLGASIAVTSDYVLTCAPLWTSNVEVKYNKGISAYNGPLGTCFTIGNGLTVSRYNGPYEQMKGSNNVKYNWNTVIGGTGWNTLADEKNNIMLVSMSPFAPRTDIGFMDINSRNSSVEFMSMFSTRYWGSYKSLGSMFKDLGPFASGKFFGDKIVYAYSSRKQSMYNLVGFLQRPSKKGLPWEVVVAAYKPLIVQDSEIGTMFGAALSAVDLNSDGFTDLLVGAPAQASEDIYDSGALHILLGGSKTKIREKRTILHNKVGGRFGTAIITSDLDGDKFPEIVVGAPFEDFGVGAVYILDGKEIYQFLDKSEKNTKTMLTDFKLTQRIVNSKYKMFGYSLHSLPDLDGNGCNEVAVGAPKSGKVVVYRSIPTIEVTLLSQIIDRVYVREQDRSFTIRLEMIIVYPEKPDKVCGTLLTSMKILGVGASFEGNSSFAQSIAYKQASYYKDVVVKLDKEESGLYKFTATAILSDFDGYLMSEEFDVSRVRISPHSYINATTSLDIDRRCKNEDCVPFLSVKPERWSGRNPYILGSTASEKLTLDIENHGSDTYESCARILVIGSQVALIKSLLEPSGWYKYSLPKPLKRNMKHSIEIEFDMTKQSSSDKKLYVKVNLHNTCDRGNNISSSKEWEMPYVLNYDHVYIDGFSNDRNVTDTALLNPNMESIMDVHKYTIINNGTVTWKSTTAILKIFNQTFFKVFEISTPEPVKCVEKNDDVPITLFMCKFDLERETALEIKISYELFKDMFVENLEKGKLYVSSTVQLNLESNEEKGKKTKRIMTTLNYIKDASWGQNQKLVILTAVLGAALIIAIICIVLYKRGFFENKEKTKLEELKDEIRKQSIRRPDPVAESSLSEKNDEQGPGTATEEENEC